MNIWEYAKAASFRRKTHSRADGPEGHHPLNVVGVAAAPWLPVRVLSSLQHKLLSTEAGVLISCPAVRREVHRNPKTFYQKNAKGEVSSTCLVFVSLTPHTPPWGNGCCRCCTPWCSGRLRWTPDACPGSFPGHKLWSRESIGDFY